MAFDKVLRVDEATFAIVKQNSLDRGLPLSQSACDLITAVPPVLVGQEELDALQQERDGARRERDEARKACADWQERWDNVQKHGLETRDAYESRMRANKYIDDLEQKHSETLQELAQLKARQQAVPEMEKLDSRPGTALYLLQDFAETYKEDFERQKAKLLKRGYGAPNYVTALLDFAKIGITRVRATDRYTAAR